MIMIWKLASGLSWCLPELLHDGSKWEADLRSVASASIFR